MVDAIVSLLGVLNSLSPLAVIALLGVVIFMLVKSKEEVGGKVDLIGSNHLHEVGDQLEAISTTLQRLEVSMSENFAYIKAKLNGGPK